MKLKETLTLVVVGLLVVSGFGVAVGITDGGTFEEDSGSNELMGDVIEIHTWEDLHNMRDDLAGNYTLMNDLGPEDEGYDDHNERRDDYTKREDAAGFFEPWNEGDTIWNEGDTIDIPFDEDDYGSILSVEDEDGDSISHTIDHPIITIEEDTDERYLYVEYEDALVGWLPVDPFTGSFDGQNYTITGLYIDRPGTNDIGLFGGNCGEVRNVGVVNADVSGDTNVGGLVGLNRGTAVNSYATGDVSGDTNVGGLVGYNVGGTVENSYATGDVSGDTNVGGLVGWNGGTVTNSYATGDVSGGDYGTVGGLLGLNLGTAVNSYATGNVSGDYAGGLVGVDHGYGTVSNSFWDVDTSGMDTSHGGEGKTTEEMKDVATFTDLSTEGLDEPWDFVGNPNNDTNDNELWEIDENTNDGYPFLTQKEEKEFQLAINIEGEGTVEVDGQEVENWTKEYVEDTDLTLEAFAEDGYEFVEWTETNETSEEITITMNEDMDMTAVFEEVEDEGGDGGDDSIPGFTLLLVLTATMITVGIYKKVRCD